MSLLNKIFGLITILILVSLIGCGSDTSRNKPVEEINYDDPQKLLSYLQKHVDADITTALYGDFLNDSVKQIIAVKETKPSKADKWGLKVKMLEADSLKQKDEVFFPEMSLTESSCSLQKLANHNYDFFYYNSGSFYLGSSGGEVFVYLVDFVKKQTYYAHLISEPEKTVTLFISKNSKEKEVTDFLLNLFKGDYPDLIVSQKDISIE